jgi:hypothetical protein
MWACLGAMHGQSRRILRSLRPRVVGAPSSFRPADAATAQLGRLVPEGQPGGPSSSGDELGAAQPRPEFGLSSSHFDARPLRVAHSEALPPPSPAAHALLCLTEHRVGRDFNAAHGG